MEAAVIQSTSMDQIHVAIVEDHPDIRIGMRFIINSREGFSSEAYSNAEDALEGIQKNVPDVVLMDINLPGMNGIECTAKLKELLPDLQIMICSVYDDDDNVFQALEAGASGYILKSAASENLMQCITDLHHGGSPMSSSIARKVVNRLQQGPSSDQKKEEFHLTPREDEILDLIAQGFRNKEIADKIFVSVNTVRTHIYNIYEKLHVQNRVEALNKTGRGFGRN
jgi:DNA-binding NarL/FixJ family response regulator